MDFIRRFFQFNWWYSFVAGIKNLISWTPIIYEDRQWDHEYFYIILHKKLTTMEEYFRSDRVWTEQALRDAERIKIAKLLCQRLIDDNYLHNALEPVEKKYGELKYSFEPFGTKGCKRMIFHESPEESKARSRAYKHSEAMRKRDTKYLFEYLAKYIDRWWD